MHLVVLMHSFTVWICNVICFAQICKNNELINKRQTCYLNELFIQLAYYNYLDIVFMKTFMDFFTNMLMSRLPFCVEQSADCKHRQECAQSRVLTVSTARSALRAEC